MFVPVVVDSGGGNNGGSCPEATSDPDPDTNPRDMADVWLNVVNVCRNINSSDSDNVHVVIVAIIVVNAVLQQVTEFHWMWCLREHLTDAESFCRGQLVNSTTAGTVEALKLFL